MDDEPFFVAFLRGKLEERGYSVATAGDALAALAFVAQATSPLVVLLDLMLPGVSGLHVLREISRGPRAAATRVVLVSAHQTVLAAAASHPLVAGRMQKPVDMGELARLLDAAFGDIRRASDPPPDGDGTQDS